MDRGMIAAIVETRFVLVFEDLPGCEAEAAD